MGLPFARIATPAVVKCKQFAALTCSTRWGGTWGWFCGTDNDSRCSGKPTGCSIWSAWGSETRPTSRWRVYRLFEAAPGSTWKRTRRSWRWGRMRWWVAHQTQHSFSQTASRHSAREPKGVKILPNGSRQWTRHATCVTSMCSYMSCERHLTWTLTPTYSSKSCGPVPNVAGRGQDRCVPIRSHVSRHVLLNKLPGMIDTAKRRHSSFLDWSTFSLIKKICFFVFKTSNQCWF